MDLTHCDVMIDGQELLHRVPIYLTEGGVDGGWRGCLHLRRGDSLPADSTLCHLRLTDGRDVDVCIRKTVSTDNARYVEALFDVLGPLSRGKPPVDLVG